MLSCLIYHAFFFISPCSSFQLYNLLMVHLIFVVIYLYIWEKLAWQNAGPLDDFQGKKISYKCLMYNMVDFLWVPISRTGSAHMTCGSGMDVFQLLNHLLHYYYWHSFQFGFYVRATSSTPDLTRSILCGSFRYFSARKFDSFPP